MLLLIFIVFVCVDAISLLASLQQFMVGSYLTDERACPVVSKGLCMLGAEPGQLGRVLTLGVFRVRFLVVHTNCLVNVVLFL